MQQDIFKRFKNSIEKVLVSDAPRGEYDNDQPTTGVELECIIKRKSGMTQSTQNSEDRESRTNFHFRPSDMQYIKVGSYIKLDGYWRSIESVDIGKHFRTGKIYFVYCEVADDILKTDDEPIWGMMSA